MKMLCYKCDHSWNYKGIINEGKAYVTCPSCMRKIRIDKSFVEDSSEQRLLTSISKMGVKTTSSPLKLPTTTSFKIEFESMKDNQGFLYHVDKRISKQFMKSMDQEETPSPGIEPGSPGPMRILPPKFKIIREIPYDSFKHLEHQKEYGFGIAN